MIHLKTSGIVCAVASAMGVVPDAAFPAADVREFVVEIYVTLPGPPQRVCFDFYDVPGTLYVGNAEPSPPFPVYKIPPGGPVEEFGNSALVDPDVVLYDRNGAIAPEPGSVLVGGQPGYISAIEPDGDVVLIFPSNPNSGFSNPNAMGFDSAGCLLFLDTPGGRILRTCSSGEIPTLLFEPPMDATHMAINSLDWVYVATRYGGLAGLTSIYVYCDGGSHLLVDGLDPAGAGRRANHLPIALGPGGVGGADVLYAISGTDLLSFEFDFATCPPQLVNTDILPAGLDGDFYNDMAFGPDGALYIAHQNDGSVTSNAIFRVFSDCNGNGINDQCDIDCGPTDGLCDLLGCGESEDCNTNGWPDECDIADGTSQDCNSSDIPDECELVGNDCNNNDTPDECEMEPPTLAPPPHNILKNRYISIDPRGAGGGNFCKDLDIRLTVSSTLVNGVTAVGSKWWANEPDENCISIVGPNRPLTPPNWDDCPTLHLTGCPIIPTSTYDIVAINGLTVSDPLSAHTQAKPGVNWHGDCVGTFTGTEWTAPNGETSIDDAVAAIKTFQNPSATPGCGTKPCNATHVSVTDMEPNLPGGPQINSIVNIADVFSIILGFQGFEYPGPQIELCPDP